MAELAHELAFVGQFWRYAADGNPLAWQAMTAVQPTMLEHDSVRGHYERYCDRFAAGRPMEDPAEDAKHWDDAASAINDVSVGVLDVMLLAERVRKNWRAREQLRLLRLGVGEAEKVLHSENGKAQRIAEKLSMALLNLYADSAERGRPQTLVEMADEAIRSLDAEQDGGISVPLGKLNEECGPWMPGDVVGVSAFSNGGKSTFIANLATRWLRRNQPVIAFPTEMRQQWLDRANCTLSGVRQKIAEKRQWKRADAEEVDAYRETMQWFKTAPFEVVNRPNVSPAEILAATRVIRRRWKDQPVVVVVDHMHRLDYGGEDPNAMVGEATKLFKNFAGDEGVIFLLLYQPKKPEKDVYRPIAGHQIRGDSRVWNEIDVHLSPFRVWVKTDSEETTPWGTQKALCDRHGKPMVAKPNAQGAKLCDEHVFLKIDKDRVGGEGPTIVLNFEKPSGAIYELETTAQPSML